MRRFIFRRSVKRNYLTGGYESVQLATPIGPWFYGGDYDIYIDVQLKQLAENENVDGWLYIYFLGNKQRSFQFNHVYTQFPL